MDKFLLLLCQPITLCDNIRHIPILEPGFPHSMKGNLQNSPATERLIGLTLISRAASGPDEGLYIAQSAGDSVIFVKRSSIAYRYDKNRREAYLKEWDLARTFDHPNLASFVKLEESDGELIHVIHCANCNPLSQLLQNCRNRNERLPVEIGLNLASQITRALRYLHARIFEEHPDESRFHIPLRPETIFLTKKGHCQIVQFSLSVPPSLSSAIIQMEDRPYLVFTAPEQCVGGLEPDYRADFYSLGMLIFELLTSKALFFNSEQIDESLITRRKVRCLHPLLSDVDPGLAALDQTITGLLQPLPQVRISNLETIENALESAILSYPRSASVDDVAAYAEIIANQDRDITGLGDSQNHDPRPDILTEISEYNAS